MSEKICLHLLILCGILCQGIIATLSDEDTKESSNFLTRKRRVITHIRARLPPIPLETANYVVSIQKNYGSNCAGAILSHYTVITAAICVGLNVSHYRVLSTARYEHRGSNHSVTSKDVYYGNPPHRRHDGIALITVDPPFDFNEKRGYIPLYEGPLATGTQVTVCGWGWSYPPQPPPPASRRALRAITVPIIGHRECANDYLGHFDITENHICTYDEQQYCARTDAGAPLVFNNKLVGIHVYKGEYLHHRNPDVYINLQRHEYIPWIYHNAILM